ncbi:MAG TPA: aldehyde dehydrogenase family protein [Myxococcota bacterium]|nr:aldehyde dehydrogenase family protein [Myxococcota bacterium]
MAIVTEVATEPGRRRRLRLADPANGGDLGEIEVQNAHDVAAALEAARKAQPAWGARPVAERARYLTRAVRALLERQDAFIEVMLRESGKPRSEVLMMEIFSACDEMTYYAKHAGALLRAEKRPLHGFMRFLKKLRIEYRPLGVVGVISPWNGPFILSLSPTIQALLAGNAVLLKPSEVTPRSGALVGELLESVGLPDGLLAVLTGDAETGAALVESGVDKICFTGSVETGRSVAQACARRLIPCTLELGGKDPMIVCEDANLDSAAGGAVVGAFLNSGHVCCSTERVYVVDAVADEFTRKVLERVSRLRQGSSGEFDIGAIFWDEQLGIIERHVADALAKGATLLAGGRRNPELDGLFFEPTVLADVSHDMLVMREETFGPVLPIMRVADLDEAVRLANQSEYGLGANVWTQDPHTGLELARRIESGSVCINDMAVTFGVLEAPFGGLKNSGVGQVHGATALRGFAHAKPIVIDRFGGRATASLYPYSFKNEARMQRLIRLLYGSPLGRWLS